MFLADSTCRFPLEIRRCNLGPGNKGLFFVPCYVHELWVYIKVLNKPNGTYMYNVDYNVENKINAN